MRPTAAILRRSRHLPVTQSIARRWQTSGGQPASYDEMLHLMEAEYPNPRSRQPKSPRTGKPSLREQLAEQHAQRQPEQATEQQHNLPDPHSGPSTTYQPVAVSSPASDSIRTPTTTGRHDARSEPRYKPANNALPRPPRRSPAQDEYKPRRVPPPMYKASPDQAPDHRAPEKPVRRASPPASQELEHAQAPETLDPVSFLDSVEPMLDFSPISEPEPSLTSAHTKDQELPATKATTPRKTRASVATAVKRPLVALKGARKQSVQNDPPAEDGHEKAPMKARMNPLETISMNPLETILIKAPTTVGTGKIFDNIFLRDSCTCAQCVDTSTRQKRFDSADIPSNIRIRDIKSKRGGDISLTWKHDVSGFGPDHTTILPYSWLKKAPHSPVTHAYQGGKQAWYADGLSNQMKTFDYNDYMSDDQTLFHLLQQLQTHGLAFIKNLPEAESSVIQTANRIGPLKNTFYGETWDVRSVSNAKNVAYTDVHLGFHMDLLYMQQPPRLQLLHCLRASEQGGVSLFSDSYLAMQQLYDLNQAAFWALVNTPVNFHYDNDNHHYFRSRRTFQLREGITKLPENTEKVWNYMEAVNWAPPFQAPFNHTNGNVAFAKSMRAWHEAAQIFRDLTEIPSHVHKQQMEPGECVIFDNRRILHARTAFAGGERWLRGAYLDDDPYLSKMRVLERTYQNKKSHLAWDEPAPSV
jgi:gamma-butyrobetaine dioxygenase